MPRAKNHFTNGIDNIRLQPGESPPPGFWSGYTRKNKVKKVRYTNGVRIIDLPIGVLPPTGYYEGSCITSIKGKKKYTNGINVKYFYPNNVPPGYYKSNLPLSDKWSPEIRDILDCKENLKNLILSIPSRKYKDIFKYFDDKSKLDGYESPSYSAIQVRIYNYDLVDLINYDYSFNRSYYEEELFEFLSKFIDKDEIKRNKKPEWMKFGDSNHSKELDIFIPKLNLAIEFNGVWSHTRDRITYDYHKCKTDICRDNGIHLIHIFEYEWKNKILKDKILTYIKYLLIPKEKLFARKLKVGKLKQNSDIKKEFLNSYHFQNTNGSSVDYCLYDSKDNSIYAIMTFRKPIINSNNKREWELSRYCIDPRYSIIGGAERLFKRFIKDYNPNNIVTYCDFSKFTGNVYNKLGFKLISNTPGYKWVNLEFDVKSRTECFPEKLKEKYDGIIDYDSSNIEKSIMTALGYLQVFDAGQGTYIWTKEN